MTIPATPRQQDLLRFVHGYQRAHGGISPTLCECADGNGIRRTSSVHRMLVLLEQRGHIRRLPFRGRAIEVLVPPTIPSIGGVPLYFVALPPAAGASR